MKVLYSSIALVLLTLYRSAGAADVPDDNDDLREMIKSLQVNFRINLRPLESSLVGQN